MTGITPSAENFRAEMARHRLTREAVCEHIGMHVNALSNFVGGYRSLPRWAAHNIGYGINRTTGIRIFEIDMTLGVVPMERDLALVPARKARAIYEGVRLQTPQKKRRRRRKVS